MIDASQVTIVIPHLGATVEAEYALKECLTSLEETVPNIEKIVAFNNGLPEGFQEVGLFGDSYDNPWKFKYIGLSEQGQCKAVNAAAATVNTPWIFVTNDDMVYGFNWWERLTRWGGKHYLCISPKLVEPRQGAPTFEVQPFGGAGGDFDKNKWLKFVEEYGAVHEIRKGFNLPFLIKRELWDLVGGYDINYDPWGSNGDSDLEYKIRLAGVQPYQNTNCIVYHFSQTSGTFHPDNQSYWQKNWDYFISKWGFPRTDEGIWEANFHMPTKEEGRIFQPDWEGKFGEVY